MKGWLVSVALTAVVVASGLGLWATWDSTQPTTTVGIGASADRLVTPATRAAEPLVMTTTIPTPPECELGEETVAADPDTEWQTIVIDTAHRLPESYIPPDLVEATDAGFESRAQVRAIVIDDLATLRAAAEANGTPVVLVSGYRSFAYQQLLFQRRVDEVGEAEAARYTAQPGHSEHQLGTAIDVLNPGASELTPDFARTPAGGWIADHAHEFGFVISYPQDARDHSCYEFEPWHLRYVGREAAAEIHESGLTPREWMLARASERG